MSTGIAFDIQVDKVVSDSASETYFVFDNGKKIGLIKFAADAILDFVNYYANNLAVRIFDFKIIIADRGDGDVMFEAAIIAGNYIEIKTLRYNDSGSIFEAKEWINRPDTLEIHPAQIRISFSALR